MDVAVPRRGGPPELPGCDLGEPEAAVGLEVVAALGQRAEVVRGGASAFRSTLAIRDRVVELAAPRRRAAARAHARAVAEPDEVGEASRWAVACATDVEHRSRARVGDEAAPRATERERAGHGRVDRAVADEFGRFVGR